MEILRRIKGSILAAIYWFGRALDIHDLIDFIGKIGSASILWTMIMTMWDWWRGQEALFQWTFGVGLAMVLVWLVATIWSWLRLALSASYRTKVADEARGLEIVEGQDFSRKPVKIDGKHFIDCWFDETTVQFNGGPFKMSKCHIKEDTVTNRVFMKDIKLVRFWRLLWAFKFLREGAKEMPIIGDNNES